MTEELVVSFPHSAAEIFLHSVAGRDAGFLVWELKCLSEGSLAGSVVLPRSSASFLEFQVSLAGRAVTLAYPADSVRASQVGLEGGPGEWSGSRCSDAPYASSLFVSFEAPPEDNTSRLSLPFPVASLKK